MLCAGTAGLAAEDKKGEEGRGGDGAGFRDGDQLASHKNGSATTEGAAASAGGWQAGAPGKVSEPASTTFLSPACGEPIFGHHFGAFIVLLALKLYFDALFRYRVVGRSLRILADHLALLC